MALTGYASGLCDKILNSSLRNTAFTAITPFLGLHTGDPAETGANEVAGGSYGRQAVTFGAPTAGTGTARKCVASGTPVAAFSGMPVATVTHWGVWAQQATGGVFVCGGSLTAPVTLGSGDTFNMDSLEFALD